VVYTGVDKSHVGILRVRGAVNIQPQGITGLLKSEKPAVNRRIDFLDGLHVAGKFIEIQGVPQHHIDAAHPVHGDHVSAGLENQRNFGRIFALQNPVLQQGMPGQSGQSGRGRGDLPIHLRHDLGSQSGQGARFDFFFQDALGKSEVYGSQSHAGNSEQ
jgi:hypothetical protein